MLLKRFFGHKMPADCACCAHHGPQGCLRGAAIKNGRCARFAYDPLRRTPKTAPPLHLPDKQEFTL